jgi:hypothetical protein
LSSDHVELVSLWGVEVEGDPDDLRNLEYKINGSVESLDSLFVARLDDLVVLRCRLWDSAADPDEAKNLASDDLRLIRSCLDLLDNCGALEIGTVFRWEPDDRITQTRDTQFTIRVKKNEADWAAPDRFRRLLAGAQNYIHLQDALREHAWAGDWYDVYKTLEALKLHHGSEKRLLAAFPAEKTQIELLKRTSNSHRHTKRAFSPVKNPMALADARRLVAKLLDATATAVKARPRPANALPIGSQVTLKHYQKSDGGKFGLNKLAVRPKTVPGGVHFEVGDPNPSEEK